MYIYLRNGGCVPIKVHNRYFFTNGKKNKSICFKAEYSITDSGNGRKPYFKVVYCDL